MKHDAYLANNLFMQSMLAKIAKLEARVAALEARPKVRQLRPRPKASLKEADARIATAILERAARIGGTTVAQICGSRGDKRVITARAEAAYECRKAGLSGTVTGLALGGRDVSTVLNLEKRHRARMGIQNG